VRPSFSFALNRKKLRTTRRREGRYLLRTNLTDNDSRPAMAILHTARHRRRGVPQSQRRLAIRPIFHQDETRIEAHIFIAFWPTACRSR